MMNCTKKFMKVMTPNEIEAANRAEATALLIRAGYRIYRPEADCYGEDLIVRTPKGELRVVQLKSRPTVNWSKYGGKDRQVWMLFPDPKNIILKREWFLVSHDMLYEWIKQKHGHTQKWNDSWSYPKISRDLQQFLHSIPEVPLNYL